ncbi:hypothetical protein J4Q44_G00117880, partial [Coregonus suidteri]
DYFTSSKHAQNKSLHNTGGVTRAVRKRRTRIAEHQTGQNDNNTQRPNVKQGNLYVTQSTQNN